MTDDAMGSEHEFNERNIDEFRRNGGKVGGQFEGFPLLLLTSTGARSGAKRETALLEKFATRIETIAHERYRREFIEGLQESERVDEPAIAKGAGGSGAFHRDGRQWAGIAPPARTTS